MGGPGVEGRRPDQRGHHPPTAGCQRASSSGRVSLQTCQPGFYLPLTCSLAAAHTLGERKAPSSGEVWADLKSSVCLCICVCDTPLFISVYFSKNIMFSLYLHVPRCTAKLSDIAHAVPTAPCHPGHTCLSVFTQHAGLLEPEVTGG